MKPVHELLENLDLGSDVAENDSALLDYFVETGDFKTILGGSVDVIRGHKGLGKSAIYRTLLSRHFDPPNTFIVDASEATSSSVFRETQGIERSEDQFKLLWTAFLATVVANEVLRVMPETPHDKEPLKDIREFLKYIGQLKDSKKATLLDSVRKAKSFAIGLGLSEEGLPSLDFTVELENEKEKTLVSEQHFLDLIALAVEVLRNNNKKLWVAMDRLDELFVKGSTNELLALRALFRSHLTICAINQGQTQVRPKIFIRTDIYDRITRRSGFTNVTHLRDINIIWSAKSMLALVAKRVTKSYQVKTRLQDLGVNVDDPKSIWSIFAPPKIESKDSNTWIARATTDSTGAFNPRNYITLLSLSVRKSSNLLKSHPMGSYGDCMLSVNGILSGFGELSRKRLDDTVLAEFPDTRIYIDRLRGGLASFDTKLHFANAVGVSLEGDELDETIELLVDSGVLARITHSKFSIAYLYRPALRTGEQERSHQKTLEGEKSKRDQISTDTKRRI